MLQELSNPELVYAMQCYTILQLRFTAVLGALLKNTTNWLRTKI